MQRSISSVPLLFLHPLTKLNFLDRTLLIPTKPSYHSFSTVALFSTFENEEELTNKPPTFKLDTKVTKGDLYGNDELLQLLNIHNIFSDDMTDNVATYQQAHSQNKVAPSSLLDSDTFDADTNLKIKKITAIASDVDGTLLSSKQTLHPRTKLAIKEAIELASKKEKIDYFFLATGKSRKGAFNSLGYEIEEMITNNDIPGVYLQGLYCVDGSGKVVFEKKLSNEAVAAVEKLVDYHGVSIVAYDGDSLYTSKQTDIVQHLHNHYAEPMPILIPSTRSDIGAPLSSHSAGFHKILLMDDDTTKLREVIRPQLEALAKEYKACVTQALPTMLELLPVGCSKALGVSKVCEALDIDMSSQLLALGDAENDAEMLERAAIGVAMGNACSKAKAAADFVMTETNDEGGAGAAMELFGFKHYL